MRFEDFQSSLADHQPPAGLSQELTALWWCANGDWERARGIVQDMSSPSADWIHAHLHRVEGDHDNAGYWYRRAGRDVPRIDTKQEWQSIARQLAQSELDI
jgi:hypothetical protein